MKNTVLKNSILGLVSLLIVGGIAFEIKIMMKPGPYNQFAQCLSDKGAKFYGAFWCSHCQSQKALFGKSASLLPYVECSTPDAKGVLPICQEKKIEGYPTWIFADSSRLTGEIDLKRLSEKTSCALPQ